MAPNKTSVHSHLVYGPGCGIYVAIFCPVSQGSCCHPLLTKAASTCVQSSTGVGCTTYLKGPHTMKLLCPSLDNLYSVPLG